MLVKDSKVFELDRAYERGKADGIEAVVRYLENGKYNQYRELINEIRALKPETKT